MARRFFSSGWGQALLAGALFTIFVGRLEASSGRGAVVGLGIAGALYGLAVLALIRLFHTRSFGLLAAGLLAGPLPIAVLLGLETPSQDRAAMLVLCAPLGLLIGALEWARTGAGRGPDPS
jgi:hypothetical protein